MSKKRGVTGQDRISLLPDHLLCQILSDLPTKIVVKTSVLSKRWKRVWLSVPLANFDVSEFRGYYEFASVVHGFLDISRETCIHKLKLALKRSHNAVDQSYLTQWIHKAVMRKVQHLDILSCRWSYLGTELMPFSLYTCETLVSLKLHYVSLPDFDYVSLPRLKIMHLEDNIYPNDALLENLISSCPVLEALNVARDVENIVKVLRVRSLSLKSLILVLDGDGYTEDDGWEVVIDAPGLSYLSLRDDQSKSFVLSSLSSPAKVDFDISFDAVRSVVRNFFSRLSSVRDMTMSGTTLKVLSRYMRHEPLPQFPNMIRFYAVFYNSDLEKLPNFLESCPNLKSLVLELEEFKKNEILNLSSSIPKCLRSSLEYVEIHTRISGAEPEMKLVKYFLENSAVLKKFTLRLGCKRMEEKSIIFMELLRFRRCSASCEVVVKILSNLPTKNDVTSSILSTRWRNIWLSIPILDIDIDDVTTFVTFASRFLDFSKVSLSSTPLALQGELGCLYLKSIHLLFYWILFENVMSLHQTKATLIGLFEAGRANKWVVTAKLGSGQSAKGNTKGLKRFPRIFKLPDRYVYRGKLIGEIEKYR
ncbi:unnamed protein product [Arabidopsis halleri]